MNKPPCEHGKSTSAKSGKRKPQRKHLAKRVLEWRANVADFTVSSTSVSPQPTDVAIGEFIDYLRVERGAAKNTVLAYTRDLRRLLAFLETRGHTLGCATREDVRAFLTTLIDAKLSGSGIARRFATVRVFYRFLRYAGKIPANPTRGIRAPRFRLRLIQSVPDTDVAKLLDYLAKQPESPIVFRDRAMIQTLYDSGLRVSELLSLRLIDLDFSQAALRVIGKGDKQRLAMMSPPQAVALKAYLERGRPVLMGNRPEHGIVFVNAPSFLRLGREQCPSPYQPGGAPLTRQALFLIVQKLGRAVLGRNIHPHQLRHSFGSTLIEHGADPRNVQALMGHADIETTMRYVHVDMRTIKQVHSKCHPRGGNR
jgi:integrase/recombinase XerD